MIVDTQNHPVATRGMLRKQNEDGEEDEYENDCTNMRRVVTNAICG